MSQLVKTQIADPVLDRLCLYLGVIFSLITSTLLLTALFTDQTNLIEILLALLVLSLVLGFLPRKLPYVFKTIVLICLFYIAGVMGFLFNAMYSISIPLFMASIMVSNVFHGKAASIALIFLCSCSILFFGWLYSYNVISPLDAVENIFVSVTHWAISIGAFALVLSLIAFVISNIDILIDEQMQRYQEIHKQLTNTYDEIRAIREIIPVCSNCRKIRDDKGFWIHVSKFLTDYPETEARESICPECHPETD